MKYSINNGTHGSTWDNPMCSPSKENMESLYSCGYKLYIDNVKQTKADALSLASKYDKEKNNYEQKQ